MTRLWYDRDGRNTNTINAAQETTSQQWDGCGQMTNWLDADSHAVLRAYNEAGSQTNLSTAGASSGIFGMTQPTARAHGDADGTIHGLESECGRLSHSMGSGDAGHLALVRWAR